VSESGGTAAQAAQLGYSLQARVAMDRVRDIVTVPGHFDVLWVLCNADDQVQRRWLRGRSLGKRSTPTAARSPHTRGLLDAFCREELSRLLGERRHHFVFPVFGSEAFPPLVALLRRLGLYRPSPIMSTLHHRFGSWWAVRAVIALSGYLEPYPEPGLGLDPCLRCSAPCTAACPSGAVTREGWQWERCAAERCSDNSPCSDQCLARLVCPAGEESRYADSVIRYHYSASLPSLREALKSSR